MINEFYLYEDVEHDQVVLCIVQNSLHHRAPVRAAVEPFRQGPLIVRAKTRIKFWLLCNVTNATFQLNKLDIKLSIYWINVTTRHL